MKTSALPQTPITDDAEADATPKVVTRSNNRLEPLLDAAASLFAQKGFRGTTMRDIAKDADMLAGSIYYHFPSKEHLLVAVYEKGVQRLLEKIAATDPGPEADPWNRLEIVLTVHLETILDKSAYATVLIRVLPDSAPTVADRLIDLRDAYETLLADIIETLPLDPDIDKRLFRLLLLGAINHVQIWRRDGERSEADIAHETVRLLRGSAAGAPILENR